MSDLLSDALAHLRLRSANYCRLELTAPWAVSYDRGGRGVHIVVRGRAELAVDGGPRCVVQGGDVLLVPGGASHSLTSSPPPPGKPVSIAELKPGSSPLPIRHGGGGEVTTIVCGRFTFDDDVRHPVLDALPPLVVLPGEGGSTPKSLRSLTEVLVDEAGAAHEGRDVVIARLSDALVTIGLRSWARTGAAETGWLRALSDPAVSAALRRMHESPAHSWTVAQLARITSMSRSAFAAHFRAMLGEPPLHYLKRFRMLLAQELLAGTALSLADVAERVGYASEPAFSVAFRATTGVPPATFRRKSRGSASRLLQMPESASAPVT
jgi:AraC-like DNA-binding protein